jgi:hypothetical protein
VSASLSHGWDDEDGEERATPPVLCAYHAVVTERLSDRHAGQIARQCPQCRKATTA